ncbi:hypothetical protein EVG20_g11116 [Dentipellis fragilis]|uniref:Uncharacterized protein n=1 Tax=Dentipellis fragilis TaxID=205917 RepID=A0A4Y9XN62_9AGAM|nr:hypothetical protein EVG20_g11116 [Dentipellis fragilis]
MFNHKSSSPSQLAPKPETMHAPSHKISLDGLPPPPCLDREAFPLVKFWTQRKWKKFQKKNAGITYVGDNTKNTGMTESRGDDNAVHEEDEEMSDEEEDKDADGLSSDDDGDTKCSQRTICPQIHYLQDRFGNTITLVRFKVIMNACRSVWRQMLVDGVAPAKWKRDIAHVPGDYYYRIIANKFEEFALCDHNWKLEKFTIRYYPTWYKTNRPKKTHKLEHLPDEQEAPRKKTKGSKSVDKTTDRDTNTISLLSSRKSVFENIIFKPAEVPVRAPGSTSTPPMITATPSHVHIPILPNAVPTTLSTDLPAPAMPAPATSTASTTPALNLRTPGTPTPAAPAFTTPTPTTPAMSAMPATSATPAMPAMSTMPAADAVDAASASTRPITPTLATPVSASLVRGPPCRLEQASASPQADMKDKPTRKSGMRVGKEITAFNLCATDWLKTHPGGKRPEFKKYWADLEADERQEYEEQAQQQSSSISACVRSPPAPSVALALRAADAFTVAAPVDSTNSALATTDPINPDIFASTNHGFNARSNDLEVLAQQQNIPDWIATYYICSSYDPSEPEPAIMGKNGQWLDLSKLCKEYVESSGPAATAPSGSTSLASPPFNPSLTE